MAIEGETLTWVYRNTSGSLPCPETKWFQPLGYSNHYGAEFFSVKISLASWNFTANQIQISVDFLNNLVIE